MQADSTRKAAQRQRFPSSAESTLHSTRREPPRSPEPMAKSGPIFCKTAQKSRGANVGKATAAISAPAQAQPAALRARRRENSHPASVPRSPPPPSPQAPRPTQPRSLCCRVLHPFAEVLEGQRQHRGVAETRDGHDERFEQISEERVLAVDAANAPDDAAVFPTCPA